MAEFLLEIGLEEVPARMLENAENELKTRVTDLLERSGLLAEGAAVRSFSTPRRLAVLATGVRAMQPDAVEEMTGPAWAVAFKDGAPTPAAQAFAKKAGVTVDALTQVTLPKGVYVGARVERPGRSADELLSEFLPKEIAAIQWPKNMYWRAGKPERFVRPVKWLLALLDEAVVPVEFAGIVAGKVTFGHRVLHGAAAIEIARPAEYTTALEKAFVLADVAARRNRIRKALDHGTRTVPGARWREDEALVETVTHLTEWPTVVLGSFAPEFLALPEEVLVTVMRDHQKYFAVEGGDGRLLPHFLTVLNTEADAAGEAIIRHGNERVLRARFSDAQFFWNFDQKTPLAERVSSLEHVTFHKDLGSYHVKTSRTRAIAAQLAQVVASRGVALDNASLDLAVTLAKTDLTTELVKEFTELQGIVGGLYARAQGAPEAAAEAIYSQYMPAAVTDAIPASVEGQILGLADRIGTIVDMFGIGLQSTGSKDPYALRRAANAVIKILAVGKLPLRLSELLSSAQSEKETADVRAFLEERFSFYLREVVMLPADVVNAVLAAGADSVPDAQARGEALAAVRGADDFTAISAAWKRTKNILRQAAEKKLAHSETVDAALLPDAAERELWEAVKTMAPEVEALRQRAEYGLALERIARLRPQVDRFFDTVMVMAEDTALRGNRLALLATVVAELGRIADFSEIVPATTTGTVQG